jgi:hypothetical protein
MKLTCLIGKVSFHFICSQFVPLLQIQSSQLTNSMVQGFTYKLTVTLMVMQFLITELKVHYYVHKGMQLDTILGWLILSHLPKHHFSKIQFQIGGHTVTQLKDCRFNS